MPIKFSVTTLLTLAAFCVNAHAAQVGPWDLDELSKVPTWEKTDKAAKEGNQHGDGCRQPI